MSKSELRKEIQEKKREAFKQQAQEWPVVLAVKGALLLAEGLSLAACSGSATYLAYTNDMPTIAQGALLVAAAFVAVPAFTLLAKALLKAGK